MRFKKTRKEVFIGSMRCTVDEETESFLKPLLPVSYRDINGMRFFRFADGHIEVKSKHQLMQDMAEEINARNGDANES